MLRAVELGLSVADLDLLDIGMVCDMFTEKLNDSADGEIVEEPTQEFFDNF